MPDIICEITENNRLIETVIRETNADPAELILSLENFRQTVNQTFTKMIKDNGEIDDYINDEASSNDESQEVPVSPKKRKK